MAPMKRGENEINRCSRLVVQLVSYSLTLSYVTMSPSE